MITELAKRIRDRIHLAGDSPTPPAEQLYIDSIECSVTSHLPSGLPTGYTQLLRIMDGFHISSVEVFGSKNHPVHLANGKVVPTLRTSGILEFNSNILPSYGFDCGSLFAFANGNGSAFCWCSDRARFVRVLHDGADIAKEYRSFEEMLCDAMQECGVETTDLTPRDFRYFSLSRQGQEIWGRALGGSR